MSVESHRSSKSGQMKFSEPNCSTATYGRAEYGECRGSPVDGGRRRTEFPPDPEATRETSLQRNVFVKRGVGHDAAADGQKPSPSSPLIQPPAVGEPELADGPGVSFTAGAQRGASQGQLLQFQGHQMVDLDVRSLEKRVSQLTAEIRASRESHGLIRAENSRSCVEERSKHSKSCADEKSCGKVRTEGESRGDSNRAIDMALSERHAVGLAYDQLTRSDNRANIVPPISTSYTKQSRGREIGHTAAQSSHEIDQEAVMRLTRDTIREAMLQRSRRECGDVESGDSDGQSVSSTVSVGCLWEKDFARTVSIVGDVERSRFINDRPW